MKPTVLSLALLFMQQPVPQGAGANGVPWLVRMDDGSSAPGSAPGLSVEFTVNNRAATICCRGAAPAGGAPVTDPVQLRSFSVGENRVAVTKVPLGYFVKSLTFDGIDLTKAPLVMPARPGGRIEVVLTRSVPPGTLSGFKVSGRVTNMELPKTGIDLMLSEVSPAGQVVRIGTIENALKFAADRKTGTFEIGGIPSGRYGLEFASSAGAAPSQRLILEIAGKDLTNLEMRFEPLPKVVKPDTPVPLNPSSMTTLQGTVEVAGATLPLFEIAFTTGRSPGMTYTVTVSGRAFSVQLPEGEYRAAVSRIPQGYAVAGLASGPLDLTEPFLVTSTGIADRFSGKPISGGARIIVQFAATAPAR